MAAETFADRLRRLASRHGLSEADLASALGVSATQAARLLDGTTKTVKLEAALRLCRRLGISPWELAGEPDPSTRGSTLPTSPDQSGAESSDPLAALADEVRLIAERQAKASAGMDRLLAEMQRLHSRVEDLETAREASPGRRPARRSKGAA